jgi:hypothetical protein
VLINVALVYTMTEVAAGVLAGHSDKVRLSQLLSDFQAHSSSPRTLQYLNICDSLTPSAGSRLMKTALVI